MPKLIQYQCDIPGCSAVRGESNHWFFARISSQIQLTIEAFAPFLASEYDNRNVPYSIICGEAHVHEFISSNLNKLFPSKDGSEATSKLMGEAEASEEKVIEEAPSPEVEVINFILCVNCGQPIEKAYSKSGPEWIHSGGGRYYGCNYYNKDSKDIKLQATPPESVLNASKKGL